MSCIDQGRLRARLDGEIRGRELEEVERHLARCPDCRGELAKMDADAGRVRGALQPLAPSPDEIDLDPGLALARFQAQDAPADHLGIHGGLMGRIFGRRWAPAWGAAVAAGLVIAAISFAPVRSRAERLLAMLRVEKVEVVSIDPVMPNLETQDRAAKMLGQLISDNVVMTMPPGKPQDVANADEASRLAGFSVRVLTARPDAPRLSVEGEQAFHLTLNRDRLQAVVDEVGRSDIQLPAAIDGAEVAVHIPKAVVARYGDIEKPEDSSQTHSHDWTEAQLKDFLVLAQVPSPTVSVPPNLDIAQVAEAGLEIGGLSPEEAHTFVQSVDWTSTLVIPVPVHGGSYQKEQVDGVEGTLISMPSQRRRSAGYTLIWIKDRVVYSLSGSGDASNAVELADSLE
ncbi:MAG TPA: zf-HC2 domain-containing protein [Terriglobia bacterium]